MAINPEFIFANLSNSFIFRKVIIQRGLSSFCLFIPFPSFLIHKNGIYTISHFALKGLGTHRANALIEVIKFSQLRYL